MGHDSEFNESAPPTTGDEPAGPATAPTVPSGDDALGVFDRAPATRSTSDPAPGASEPVDESSSAAPANDDWQSLLDETIPPRSHLRHPDDPADPHPAGGGSHRFDEEPTGPKAAVASDKPFDDGSFDDSEIEDDRRRLLTRIGVASAMLVAVLLVAAVLVPAVSDDGGAETVAADTAAAVAESEARASSPDDYGVGGDDIQELFDGNAGRGSANGDGSSTTGTTDDLGLDTASDDDPDSTDDDTTTSSADDDTTTSSADDDTTTTTAADETTTETPEAATPTTRSTTTTTEAPTTTTTRPTTTTTAAPTTTACSGVSWDLVLEDHFNGNSLNTSNWLPYNSSGNAGYGLRRPEAIGVWDGNLNITAQMQNGTLVSGGMQHRRNQQYGRYEFRVRTDQDFGESTSGVVLTWPQSNAHPRDGENNIYETLATPGDRHEFYTFIHEPYGTVHDQVYIEHHTSAAAWHTMVMEWTPGWIKIYRDGSLIKHIDDTADDLVPDNPHFLAIQLDAWKHQVNGTVRMQVDYVKVWSYRNGC